MDSRNHAGNMNRRKVVGLISLIIFSLAFIFACLKKILPIGKWLVGTFGGLVYPMSFIFAFISLAVFLGFSYTKNKKPLAMFVIATMAVLFAIHSIDTYKTLDKVVGFSYLKSYLSLSYSKVTIVGSFGSILSGMISMLLGGMGTIVAFVIIATIFAGLLIDYEIYGKYEEPHIKKLAKRAVREAVSNSDNNVSENGEPDYSYMEKYNSENEISVDAKEYEAITSGGYSNTIADVGTILDSNDDEELSWPGYEPESERYQPPTEHTEIFKPEIPDVYSDDANEQRRQYINDIYGRPTTYGETTETSQTIDLGSPIFGNEISQPASSGEEDTITFPSYPESENEIDEGVDSDFEKFLKSLNGGDDSSETVVSDEPVGLQPQNNNPIWNRPVEPKPEPVWTPPVRPDPEPVWTPPAPPKQPEPKQRPIGSQGAMFGVRYNAPTLNLLKTPVPDKGDYTAEQNRKTMMLENVLESFNISAKVKNIVRGPKITRYELSLPYGVSVKRIPNCEDDIKAALAAKTVTIRAPIPGSSFVGIELENDTFTTVYQRELFESEAFQNCKDPLPIAIGKDISGEIVVKSLVDMVHLLIAGSTGSGKSVFIHNIVLSLIYKNSPDDLRLIMIDPKRVEFPIYNGLPHLLTPEVVAGSQKAINALRWCVKEMDRRYDLMQKAGYNNIKPYNKSDLVKAGQFEKLPYIVIVVDELAEIMQADKKNAEAYIQRITQLARACGMHMVVATQRPSVDIITGVIKNNIPSRIAFSLQSGIDSKTILTTVGAEKLLGKGDMIFAPTGTSAWPRLQASYATDEEIRAVIQYTIKNNDANFDQAVEAEMDKESSDGDGSSVSFNGGDGLPPKKDKLDDYFKVALKYVMQNGGASTSYIQRRLSIGYSRAARIIDQMSERGYIAQATGSKPRKILITPEQFREEFGEDYDSID